MSLWTKPSTLIFAPTDGAGAARKVVNSEVQTWGAEVERIIDAAVSGGDLLIFETKAALDADLAHAANTAALVIGDTLTNDGLYKKSGASGAGSWSKVGNVPGQGFVKATDNGGTANAIAATTPVAVNETQLILLPIAIENTSSPVTVAFNGGSALTIKSITGADVEAGALKASSVALGSISGSTFRLSSDVDSTANVAAAENAQAYAEEWANKAEDSLVSAAAGGDQVDDYSALHWSKKAAASAASATIGLRKVAFVTTTNVDLAGGGLANATTHDGYTAATGDLALVAGQTTDSQNGVYDVPASGAASRNSNFDAWDDYPGAVVAVLNGTVGAGSIWRCTAAPGGTLDTTAINFERSLAGKAVNVTNQGYGYETFDALTTGTGNTAWGYNALKAVTEGLENTAIGYLAGRAITTGDYNVCIGPYAGYNITGGDNHIMIGDHAGYTQSVNSNNVCVGGYAGELNPNGGLVALGYRAARNLSNNGTNLITLAVGIEAAYLTTYGNNNSVFSMGGLYLNSTGSNHTVGGHDASKTVSTNDGHSTWGKNAAFGCYGSYVTAVGAFSGSQANDGGNPANGTYANDKATAIGAYAGNSAQGDNYTALGFEAGDQAGSGSVHIGHQSGKGVNTANVLSISNSSSLTYIRGDFSTGFLGLGKASDALATAGVALNTNGEVRFTGDGLAPVRINRLTDDGGLILFYQDTTQEGDISVSGTTVSLNGAHLSRWSQWKGKAPKELYRGTILSNVDDLCVWLGLRFTDHDGNERTVEDGVPKGAKIGDVVEYSYEYETEETVEVPAQYQTKQRFVHKEVEVPVVRDFMEGDKIVRRVVMQKQMEPVTDPFPVVDGEGNPVLDALGRPEIHREPRKESYEELIKEAETFTRRVTKTYKVKAEVVKLRNDNLPKCELSKVEADCAIAGVYQGDDLSDELGDIYIATVGDFVIRIGKGAKVKRGDLICSAGDGTGRPLDPDAPLTAGLQAAIVAKVTSKQVVETLPDGSYIVPCYLMAS